MNAELKAKWVAALRSGNYEQGWGLLRGVTDKYCCLGVACDISGQGQWIKRYEGGSDAINMYGYTTETGNSYYNLVVDLRAYFDIPAAQVKVLIQMNDGRHIDGKKTFAEIADWIEQNL